MLLENPVSLPAHRVFYCLCFLFSITISQISLAETITPFSTIDQNPLVTIYGLPTPVAATLLNSHQTAFYISANFSNTINEEQAANEILFIDIETHRLNLILDHALQQNWMLRLQIPFIKHYGGFMDKWIDNYHHLIGLPEGVRPNYPGKQIAIYYELNGITLLNNQEKLTGIGDVSLQIAYQLTSQNDFALSYWSSLKLPTGNSQNLTGSGHADISFWIASQQKLNHALWVYTNGGILLMKKSDVLTGLHNNHAFFLTAGLQFNWLDNIQLKLQLDNHSAFYKTDTDFLGPVTQLTFGGSIAVTSESELDIAIAEDIQTNASPDVNFNITWRKRF
ncbi:MAG: DUF3187 family protein [Gammaproteobacteria bacterium]|nr:DUF3187 family protein [Gammaproteobacteria bacterium]